MEQIQVIMHPLRQNASKGESLSLVENASCDLYHIALTHISMIDSSFFMHTVLRP